MKTLWEGFSILDATMNTYHSSEEVKISTLQGVWKKLIPTIMDDCDRFKTSVVEVTVDVAETENYNEKWSLKM